ncbi:hypothetical protein ZWY2020_050511 [Hordeum vulgare]|nr:hypothetical protein ZWY2020_050511 [Hordeum vulgare]
MAEISPLHRVIDAARWDAERLLGRLIILVHAAFLDAVFVVHADRVGKSGRVPTRAGATASTRQHLRRTEPLRGRPSQRVPAVQERIVRRAVAPLLSRGLGDTARALTDDGACGVAALWRELTEKLCRSTLVAVCPGKDALLSLSVDVLLDILARLNGLDILMLSSTCAGLSRLVADHDSELWKNRYMALFRSRWADDSSGTTNWMELWCKLKQRLHERAKFGEYIREERRKKLLRYRAIYM